MIEKNSDYEDDNEPKTSDEKLDIDDLKKRMKHLQKQQQFTQKVTVNLGNEEYDHGKQEITPDIFDGYDKIDNTELFLQNYQKTMSRYEKERKLKKSLSNAETPRIMKK